MFIIIIINIIFDSITEQKTLMLMIGREEKKLILYQVKKLSFPNWTISSPLLAKR